MMNSLLQISVTGEANSFMDHTSLTVRGSNQSAVAHSHIELSGNAKMGISHWFLWLFLRPVYRKFETREPVRKDFMDKIGNYPRMGMEHA